MLARVPARVDHVGPHHLPSQRRLLLINPRGARAVVLAAYSPLVAVVGSTRGFGSSARRAYEAAIYTELTSEFALTVAAILGSCAVYLCALSVVYLARGGKKWWRMLRIDVICGGIILFGLDVAWWAKALADYRRRGYSYFSMSWLVVIVDIVLFIVALGAAGLALYAAPKLKKRPDVAVSNVSRRFVAHILEFLIYHGGSLTRVTSRSRLYYSRHRFSGSYAVPLSWRSS